MNALQRMSVHQKIIVIRAYKILIDHCGVNKIQYGFCPPNYLNVSTR